MEAWIVYHWPNPDGRPIKKAFRSRRHAEECLQELEKRRGDSFLVFVTQCIDTVSLGPTRSTARRRKEVMKAK